MESPSNSDPVKIVVETEDLGRAFQLMEEYCHTLERENKRYGAEIAITSRKTYTLQIYVFK